MELSNYQAFMECMRKWEKIGCNILCGLALWEQMQDCDRCGVPYTDIDIEAVSQDVAYRLNASVAACRRRRAKHIMIRPYSHSPSVQSVAGDG